MNSFVKTFHSSNPYYRGTRAAKNYKGGFTEGIQAWGGESDTS